MIINTTSPENGKNIVARLNKGTEIRFVDNTVNKALRLLKPKTKNTGISRNKVINKSGNNTFI